MAFIFLSSVFLATSAFAADVQPRLKRYQELFGWSGSTAPDLTSAGTITGTTVATTGLICTGTDKLTTDANGNFRCATDVSAGGAAHNLLSATHTDSVVNAVSRGSLIYGNATPAWDELTVGGTNTVLVANATDASWSTSPTVTNLTATSTVTGAVVSAISALQVGSDYVRDLTGSGLSIDGSGRLNATGGSGTVTSISQGTNMNFSIDPIVTTGTINLAASPAVTNLTATNTITGAVVSATGALQIGSDYLRDLTGSNLVLDGNGSLDLSATPTLTALTITQGTITGAALPLLTHTATWNDGAVLQQGIVMNITDTSSSASSTLLDIQVGGNSMFLLDKFGNISDGGSFSISRPNGTFSISSASNQTAITGHNSLTAANTNPVVSLTSTWNTSGAANGIFYNVTDTSSAATSLLMDLQVGSTSKFNVSKVGDTTAVGTVTGAVVSATGALQVGSDYVRDLTGSNLTVDGNGSLDVSATPTVTNLTATNTVTGAAVTTTGVVCQGSQVLATDANGNFRCHTDAGGAGTVTSITQGTNMSFSVSPITTTGTINLTASPAVTNLTATGTVTGATVATTGLICLGSQVLATDASGNFKCHTDQGGSGSNHNFLSATHSDTVANSPTRGDLVVANSTPAWARFAVGGSNTVLTANGTDPAWSATPTVTSLTATSTVTGAVVSATSALQVGSDYLKDITGSGLTITGQSLGIGAGTGLSTSNGTLNLVTPVTVANGGTGDTTLTLNGVVYGNGASAAGITSQGGTNSVLTANAGAPSFSATPTVTSLTATNTVTGATVSASSVLQVGSDVIKDITGSGLSVDGAGRLNASGGSNHNMLSATHSDSVTAGATRGDLIVANSTPNWARFAVGGTNTVLTSNGTDPAWSATPTVTNLTATGTVTGAIVSATSALQVGSDYLNDITGTGLAIINGSSLVAPVEKWFSASAMEPLEASDLIPPLTKTTGTNLDEFSISYDAATSEGRKVTFVVTNTLSGGNATFIVYWWSIGQTTGNVVWQVSYTKTGQDNETWDPTLATTSATCTVAGTVKQLDLCTMTVPVATLGWAVGDRITLELYRLGANGGDTMTGDGEVAGLLLRIQ